MTCAELAREYGLRTDEVSTVVKADGLDYAQAGSAWLIPPASLRKLRPKLDRLRRLNAAGRLRPSQAAAPSA